MRPVDRDAPANRAAEQFIHRNAEGFALDVEQGVPDGGDGALVDAVGRLHLLDIQQRVDRLDRPGSVPISASAMPWMTEVRPRLPSASVYSDQPTRPSSVVTFRNENVRQPASQCRSSILAIFIGCSLARGPRPAPGRDATLRR